ncbi:fibronectin type III domain protein [Teladorsagia circumcincta]|uniref:Fibronectin type III domain protein n=2 Tax=Teladorsagia circumcincta TaxID=45464 RepID=A0A2G9UDI5_TELCI|nr:fibronectin type III domain protein [Teladorsagia circumcincta]
MVDHFKVSKSLRVRRESRGTESLLTVEWEGIQTGDHPDTDVKGFLVEYRAEKDKHWMVHSGIIPYKGPNHQYRVQIPKLPTGVAYFVRIKVLGAHNEILVETAEIRARNEIVSIKCESGKYQLQFLVVDEGGFFSVHWQRPSMAKPVTKFVVEYRLPNETFWRTMDEAEVEEGAETYTVTLPVIPGTSIFTVRLMAIGADNEVIGRTEEVTMGEAAANACVGAAGIPEEINVDLSQPTVLRFSWSKPNCDESVAPIDGYEYLIHQSDQQTPHSGASYIGGTSVAIPDLRPSTRVAYKERGSSRWTRVYGCPQNFRCPAGLVDPDDYCYRLPNLFYGVHYISRVSYNLTNGVAHDPGSTIHFSLMRLAGVEQPSLQVGLTQPRIEQQGPRNVVYWSTTGDASRLLGYQVDIRRDGDRDWSDHGAMVPAEPSQTHFRQSLGPVPVATYYLRRSSQPQEWKLVGTTSMYNGEAKETDVACSAIVYSSVAKVLDGILMGPRQEFLCDVCESRGVRKKQLHRSVRIRARNSAGHSAWTPAVEVRTPPGGELIVGPNIAYRQGIPILTWQSRENVDDQIESFVLEWKTSTERDWRQHRNPIPFSGWQRPYTIDLGELPKGHTYQVRVVVKDRNRNVAFTSPIVQVQTQSACTPPRRAPTNLQVSPIGPTQIRLTWAPLHESEWNCDRMWWSFEVQAANPAGETQWSRTETAQTQDASPGPVVDLRVQPVGPDRFQVSWRPPINPNGLITGYEVTYQLISKGMCDQQQDAPRTLFVTSPNHVITGLHPHSRYRVGVAAKTTIAGERVSQEVQTEQSVPSAAPVYLRVEEVRETDASASWQAPPCLQTNGEITEYEYEVTPADRRAAPQRIANNVRGTKAQITGLQPFTRYNIKVRAYTSRGPGPWSTDVAFQTAATQTVTAPPFVKVINTGADNAHVVWQSPHPQSGYVDKYKCRVGSVTSNRADVTWSQPDCELRNGKITGYEYELESLDPWGDNTTAQHSTERLTLNDLIPYNEYRIRVRAQNAVGEGPYSEWVRFITHPAAPPAPTDLQEEGVFPHALEISFAAPTPPHGNLDYYRIRHTPSGQLNYKEVRVEAERLQCSDASKRDRLCFRVHDLDPEQDYEIQVAAHTENGAWSEWSEPLNARTEQQNIPVLERELEVIDTKPESITLRFEGVPQDQAAHVVGYVLEFKSEDDDDWSEYNGVIKHRRTTTDYKVMVKQLETATNYFFRLKVVGKNDKRGAPGPETKAMTSCGRPEEPPSNVKIDSDDFETVKITWTPPSEDSWRCDDVEFVIDYVNTTSRGTWTVPVDAPSELVVATMPGTRWEVKMRTQTVEDGAKPQTSKWSEKASLTTQSLPGELFVTVEPTGPREALVTWDLPDKDQKWNYGVDISYRLKQLGGCNEAATGSQEPITKLNIQEKQVPLEELAPGSVYEVTVTPRRPPSLHSSIVAPKTVRTFKTKNDVPTGPPMNLQSSLRKDTELVQTKSTAIQLTWLPPYPEKAVVTAYRMRYSPRADDSNPTEIELSGEELSCSGYKSPIITGDNLCTTVKNLQPATTYRFAVQGQSASGTWGEWSSDYFSTTRKDDLELLGGSLKLLSAGHDNLKVKWTPPAVIGEKIDTYQLFISVASELDQNPKEYTTPGSQTDYHFR